MEVASVRSLLHTNFYLNFCRVLHNFLAFFVCFHALPCLILYFCMLLFSGDVQCTPFCGIDMYLHAHVYTCLHALCLQCTLSSVDLPVSAASSFSALVAVAAMFLLCVSCLFQVYVRNFHCCYVIKFVHGRPLAGDNINPLGTPVDTPIPRFHVGVPGPRIIGGNTQMT